MTTLDQYTLGEIADRLGEDVGDEIRTDYSGRGMYGRTCVGYCGDSPFGFVLLLAAQIANADGDYHHWDQVPADRLEDVIGELESEVCRDSMGRSTIWYWPTIQAEPAPEVEP